MGSECSADEREFRYLTFHQAIYAIENDIKKDINNLEQSQKKYVPFGLINQGLCNKYKFLLNENFDKNEARNKIFEYKDLIKINKDKDYSYIHKDFRFCFPSNFIFVNKDILDVIQDYIPDKYKNRIKSIFNTIIGGGCLIMKDMRDINDKNPFRYIILYYEIKENKGNEIDFFFYINDKTEKLDADKYILENNIWNYFKNINYNYKDEFGIIYNKNKMAIGYVVRCCDVNKIEQYISKPKQKEKNEVSKFIKLSNIDNNVNIQNIHNQNFNSNNINNFNKNSNRNIIHNSINNINNSFNPNIYINNNNNNLIQNNQVNMMYNMYNLSANNMNNNININNNINNIQKNMQNNMHNFNLNNMINNNQSLIVEINSLKNENLNLRKTIQLKEEENKELKRRIDNLINNQENKPNLVDFNNIKIIQFISMDHSLIYPIKCLPSDTFAEVEEKLYKIYPEYRETNNLFQVDGRTILRFKTIAENNIQNGHPVQITKIE